jgi:NAD(P)H-dependent FMN reductase
MNRSIPGVLKNAIDRSITREYTALPREGA